VLERCAPYLDGDGEVLASVVGSTVNGWRHRRGSPSPFRGVPRRSATER